MFFVERGNFLALDLGGTNFRILLVNLDEDKDHPIKIDQQSYFVPKSLMTGNGTDVSNIRNKKIINLNFSYI